MTTRIGRLSTRERLMDARCLHRAALAGLLLVAFPQLPLQAQGLNAEDAVETIIGSEVQTEERMTTADQTEQVLQAIARADETAMEVRVVFNLESVTIVFIPEAKEDGSPIAEAAAEHRAAIRSLRQAVQGNAMLFHSIDSQSVLLDDVLALEFSEDGTATFYVAGNDPNQ